VVQVVGDTTVEPNETFTLQVSNSNSAEKGNASATGTILNDDVAIPTLVIDDITTVEGTGAGTTTGTFTVTLSAQPVVGSPVMVNYVSLDVSAVSPADFGAVSGTLTFTNGGPLTQSIPVTIVRDNLDELDEAYSVLLSGASNATIADAKGDAIIQDDDTATPSIADISQNEGNSGNTAFTFTVTLSNPSALALDFSVSTSNGSAIAPGDYTAVTAQPVSFTAGQTSQPVTVQVVGDGLVEANETFTLAIFQGAGVIDRGIQPIDTAVATILNDDVALDLSINDSSLVEGTGPGTSNATFTVTLSGQPLAGTPVTVNYAMANGSALAVTDYTAASGTLTFANGGALSQTITVALTRDNIDENDESYFVNLSNATNATIYDSQGAGTIVDDDTASLSIDDVTLPEGNGGGMTAFVFTVTTSNPSATAISVNYATSDGSAGSPSDFAPITGGIIIPALATSTTVTVNVVADDLAEPTETFTVNLFGAIGAVIADGQAIGTILGDEPSVPVTALDQAGLLLLGLLLLSVGAVVARRRD
jgi:carbon monoxide dehydrogenase subunit G